MSEACCEACRLFGAEPAGGAASAGVPLQPGSQGLVVTVTEKGGSPRALRFLKAQVVIGRVQGNDVVLPKGNVSKQASRLSVMDGRVVVVDLKSTCGTYVNNRRITGPQSLQEGDKIYIGDFMLTVEAL